MNMKRFWAAGLAATMALSLTACGSGDNNASDNGGGGDAASNDLNVGVLYYNYADTYIASVRAALSEKLDAAGIEHNDQDGNNNQTTQTEQVQTVLTAGAEMLVVNLVNTSSDDAANGIIDKGKESNLPVLFFNREVSDAVISGYDKAAFVGTDAPEAGHLQGQMIGEYLLENYDSYDLNGDGKISYILFKGEQGNAEAEYRTQYAVEDANALLTEAGKPELEFYDPNNSDKYLVDRNGSWSAAAAQEYMTTALSTNNDSNNNMIELIICNNDNMAEGCISALESAGYNNGTGKTIPVFGVDATDSAKELIANGKMTGTVKQDAEGMAAAIAQIAKAVGEGTALKDAVAATAESNTEMYSVAEGVATKLYVAYAPYTA